MRPLIAGNWKMNGDMAWTSKPSEFAKLLPQSQRETIDVLLCPPMPFISPLKEACVASGILLGAQNCHEKKSGAHTGEVSADMLTSVGASYVIVGHSERRAAGESSAAVMAKAKAASNSDLIPIICVGESLEQREAGKAEHIVTSQIKASLPDITDYVIAYEPIWAIGTGKTATSADIAQIHSVIRGLVSPNARILYGGSVKPANAQEILSTPNVNGALIGGASLEMDSLAAIAKAVL